MFYGCPVPVVCSHILPEHRANVFSLHPFRPPSIMVAASSSSLMQAFDPIINPMKSGGILMSFDMTNPDFTISAFHRSFIPSLTAKPIMFPLACPFKTLEIIANHCKELPDFTLANFSFKPQ